VIMDPTRKRRSQETSSRNIFFSAYLSNERHPPCVRLPPDAVAEADDGCGRTITGHVSRFGSDLSLSRHIQLT
jgi:hypothetical protein